MSGFKNFVLRGNLIEIAVAFIIAAAFARRGHHLHRLADQPAARRPSTRSSAKRSPSAPS